MQQAGAGSGFESEHVAVTRLVVHPAVIRDGADPGDHHFGIDLEAAGVSDGGAPVDVPVFPLRSRTAALDG